MRLVPSSHQKVYLDHNATTPLLESVRVVVTQALSFTGNPSSVHASGRYVRKIIEEARCSVADYAQTTPASVIFTSGATEANNLALKGFQGSVLVSSVEHDSVYDCRSDVAVCPVDAQGQLELTYLETWLTKTQGPKLVSVMGANNETGIIQPLQEISALVKTHGAFIHCDAVQAVKKIDVDWASLDIDMISISAHKIGGLQGIGALLLRNQIPLTAQIRGGGQERSYRAGTENALGIVSLKKAIQHEPTAWAHINELRLYLEANLKANYPDITIFGDTVARLPNTTALTMPGVSSALQVMNFDLNGICVSAGSACSSGKVKPSRVLQAMGVNDEDRDCALRVSMGLTTTRKDIDYFISVWKDLYDRFSITSLKQGKKYP